MIGVWVNALTVIVGGLIGTALRGGIPQRFSKIVTSGVALCVLLIGISGAIATGSVLLVIVSIVLGSVLGEALRIEDGLDHLAQKAQDRFAKNDSSFAQGLVSATLLFCVGAMAVVGSLEAGLQNKGDTLLAKAALDGVTSVIFASTMGPGVIFSAIPLTLYQGGIALLSGLVEPYLSTEVIREMSAVGSVLIIGLSLNMLDVVKERIKIGNMLPAMLIPVLYYPLANWIGGFFA